MSGPRKNASFSFIIPTYNAGVYIECCLKSIREQDYPQELVEILVIDGGSEDNTLEVARQYNCKVLNNTKRLAEYGVQLGIQNARADYVAVFAADNELVSNDWIAKVADVFDNYQDISAVWGRLASGQKDPGLNKYFALIQSDPLNWFLNNNLDKYKKVAQIHGKDYFIFKVSPSRPLVWGANGLVYRKDKIQAIWSQPGYLGDNDAFQYMIEQGDNNVAYFDTAFVYHHHVATIADWVKKWKRNFVQHFLDKRQTRNMNWLFTSHFKIKLFFWVLYSAIPVFSLSHSIYLSFRDRNLYWYYHAFISFAQFTTYSILLLFTKKGRNLIKDIVFTGRKGGLI